MSRGRTSRPGPRNGIPALSPLLAFPQASPPPPPRSFPSSPSSSPPPPPFLSHPSELPDSITLATGTPQSTGRPCTSLEPSFSPSPCPIPASHAPSPSPDTVSDAIGAPESSESVSGFASPPLSLSSSRPRECGHTASSLSDLFHGVSPSSSACPGRLLREPLRNDPQRQ